MRATVMSADASDIRPLGAPDIENSTKQERLEYVLDKWRCCHSCEICGKCSVLRGVDAEIAYEDYIEGRTPYMEITKRIRNLNY